MALQRRTDETPFVIQEFGGVDQVFDELKLPQGAVPWLTGAFPSRQKTVNRIPGKKLVSSATTGGMILTLHQLTFMDRNVVLVHRDSAYLVEDDLRELTGDVDVSPLLPTEPFLF